MKKIILLAFLLIGLVYPQDIQPPKPVAKLEMFGSNWVSPQMFGAKADGVTDDADAFNKMISSVNNDSYGTEVMIYIPNGVYKIGSTLRFIGSSTIPKSINIIGQSTLNTRILYYGSRDSSAFFFNKIKQFKIQSFSIHNVGDRGNTIGMKFYSDSINSGIGVIELIVVNNFHTGISVGGIDNDDASESIMFNAVEFTRNNYGVIIDNVKSTSNNFYNCIWKFNNIGYWLKNSYSSNLYGGSFLRDTTTSVLITNSGSISINGIKTDSSGRSIMIGDDNPLNKDNLTNIFINSCNFVNPINDDGIVVYAMKSTAVIFQNNYIEGKIGIIANNQSNNSIIATNNVTTHDSLIVKRGTNIYGVWRITLNNNVSKYSNPYGSYLTNQSLIYNNGVWITEKDETIGESTQQDSSDIKNVIIVEGWYAQNITTTTDKQLMYRGLGALDYYFRPTQNVHVRKVVFESTSYSGTINIYVYKNGFWTGAILTVKNNQTKSSYIFAEYNLILTENDYLTFKYDCNVYNNPDIRVYAEVEVIPEYTGDLTTPPTYTVTWEAVGGGKVTVTTTDNDTLQSGVKVIEGNELIFIAEGWSNKDFWLWTGIDCPDSNRINDTLRVTVINDLHVRARFKAKTRTYQVVLADPYPNGDTTHAYYCYQSFMATWNDIDNYLFDSKTISILKYNYGENIEAAYKMADSVGAMVIFFGVSGFASSVGDAIVQKYYPVQTIVPTGANEMKKIRDYAELPAQILTGVGLSNTDYDPYSLSGDDVWSSYCVTATDVEIRGYDRISQPVQLVDSVNIYDVPQRYQTVRVSNDTVFGKYFKPTSTQPRIPGDNTGRSNWRFLKVGQRLVINNIARGIINIVSDTMLIVSSSYGLSGFYSAFFIQNLSSFSNPDVAAHYAYWLYYVAPIYIGYEDWYAARLMMRYGTYDGSNYVMKLRDMDNGYNQIKIYEYFNLSTYNYVFNFKNLYGQYYFRSIDPYLRR